MQLCLSSTGCSIAVPLKLTSELAAFYKKFTIKPLVSLKELRGQYTYFEFDGLVTRTQYLIGNAELEFSTVSP